MKFHIVHNNINVKDLERSIAFYEKALGLMLSSRNKAGDGSFQLAFLGDGMTGHAIELTWLRDKTGPYDLGDNESHIAFKVDDFDKAFLHHTAMGCVVYENKPMGLYFIEDPDGYWLEIIPEKRS